MVRLGPGDGFALHLLYRQDPVPQPQAHLPQALSKGCLHAEPAVGLLRSQPHASNVLRLGDSSGHTCRREGRGPTRGRGGWASLQGQAEPVPGLGLRRHRLGPATVLGLHRGLQCGTVRSLEGGCLCGIVGSVLAAGGLRGAWAGGRWGPGRRRLQVAGGRGGRAVRGGRRAWPGILLRPDVAVDPGREELPAPGPLSLVEGLAC
mmetsp:Transcript_91539/g.158683  ORF Transcript_91539/g.158683 Transcript_91539/m.158683 type:complete len:205 (+) Transcript_91539:202-816(+)